MLFPHLLIWSCDFCLSFCLCDVLRLLICELYHPCIPGMNPTWSWCMIFLIYCWMCFVNILLRILASMSISDIGLKFSLLCPYLASSKECGSLPSSWIFWNSLWRIGVSSSLNVLWNSAVRLSSPGLLCARRFLVTASISWAVTVLFGLFLLFWYFSSTTIEDLPVLYSLTKISFRVSTDQRGRDEWLFPASWYSWDMCQSLKTV